MKRSMKHAMLIVGGLTISAMAGEATTNAWANNAGGGTAGATASYDGAPGGMGVSRTRTQTGDINLSRGLAVGVDKDGLDFSFSHAIAPQHGPAYAGTFNVSVGTNGQVNGSYGTVLSQGGVVREVEAGGTTRSGYNGASTALARGDANPGGQVTASTHSYSSPRATAVRPYVRTAVPQKFVRRGR